MTDANQMLLKILEYHREHDMNVENVHLMRNAAPVSEVTFRYGSELTQVSVLSRQFVDALIEHGLTIYVAVNMAGDTRAFITQAAASKWLEDFPGDGAHVPRIEPSQVFFR